MSNLWIRRPSKDDSTRSRSTFGGIPQNGCMGSMSVSNSSINVMEPFFVAMSYQKSKWGGGDRLYRRWYSETACDRVFDCLLTTSSKFALASATSFSIGWTPKYVTGFGVRAIRV